MFSRTFRRSLVSGSTAGASVLAARSCILSQTKYPKGSVGGAPPMKPIPPAYMAPWPGMKPAPLNPLGSLTLAVYWSRKLPTQSSDTVIPLIFEELSIFRMAWPLFHQCLLRRKRWVSAATSALPTPLTWSRVLKSSTGCDGSSVISSRTDSWA